MRHTLAVFSLVAMLIAFASPSLAQTSAFDLPTQPLAESLKAVGAKANLNVMVSPALVDGKQAPPLKANVSAKDALAQLLKGSGLDYHFINDQTVVIREKTAPAANDPPTGQITNPDSQNSTKEGGKNSSQDFRVAQVDQKFVGAEIEQPRSKQSEKAKDEGLSEIVVTGTLIHNVAPITPVMTITQADLIDQGYTQLADAIFDLPQNFQGAGTSPASNVATGVGGPQSANNLTYASGINLRGLGGSATLVMLNGRRLAPTAFGGTVDISQIPVSVIDRVEILTDGASALYGSDAVAGVVNIITKRDFSGLEIGGRSTGISKGKTPDYGADIVGGYSWDGGGLVASADYQKDNPLFARNRSFTDALANPWALTPQDQAEHFYLSVHQAFAERLNISMDSLLTHRDYQAQNNLFDTPTPYVGAGKIDQYNVSPQLDYTISKDWTATLIGEWSKEQDSNSLVYPPPPYSSDSSYPVGYEVISLEPRVDGVIFRLPGGPVRAALGAQWRDEKLRYSRSEVPAPYPQFDASFDSSRRVASVYGELMVPIVGRDNAVPFVQEIRIDLSGRYDHYSDFGGTTNPKIGVSWSPVSDLNVHGSYARSFQAPTLYELAPTGNSYAAVAPSADPNTPSGSSLGLANISGSNPNLQPETAKIFNAGLTYEPSFVPGLKLEASFFSIDFDNEITTLWLNPFCVAVYCTLLDQAQLGSLFQKNPPLSEINSILNNPAFVVYNWAAGNYAPAPYIASDIKSLANIGLENAASTRIRGVDFTPRYIGPETQYGRFRVDLDASYFIKYQERVTSGSPALDIDNLTYDPLRLRAKANVGWQMKGWGTNVRVNFANAYTNTVDTSCSSCRISSWTTVDFGLSYTVPKSIDAAWLSGVRFAVIATNVLDRAPPFVSPGAPGSLGYDPINASPLMRSFSVTFSRRWGGEGTR